MKTRTRQLGMESLENRNLMAGNVTVRVTDGNMTMTGDNAANAVTLTQVGTNRYRIQGSAGTTINRQAGVTVTFTKDVGINLRGGNDRLIIGKSGGLLTRFKANLSINMAAGRDFLTLFRVVAKDGVTSMGSESQNERDIVNVRRTKFTGAAILRTGGGDDRISLLQSQALRTLRAETGSGNDEAIISNSTAGNVFLRCGAGDDTAFFSGRLKLNGDVFADGGAGTDTANEAPGTTYEFAPDSVITNINFEGGNATV